MQLPAVHIKLYLTLRDDYFSNPWAEINNTYPIRADQISKKCRKTICKYIYSAIEEFDQKNPKELLSYDMEESWGHNFFRLIKEDFNPVDDIRILFEDGKIINHYSDIDPKEAVEKYKKVSEEIEPYLK